MSRNYKVATILAVGIAIFLFTKSISFAQIFPGNTPLFSSTSTQTSPNKIMVKFRTAPNTSMYQSIGASLAGAQLLHTLPGGNNAVYYVANPSEALNNALSNPNVEAATLVPKVFATKVSNDTHFDKQWALPNMCVAGSGTTAWDLIPTPIAGTTEDVKVAIIDTGIDVTHADITGKIDTSGNDYVGCKTICTPAGSNNCTSSCSSSLPKADDAGHGTHVAGIIGAVTDNSKGIAGAGWGVKLMSVKVLGKDGSGDFDEAMEGVKWAADHGAKVINMSWGAVEQGVSQQAKDVMQDAMDYAWSKGAVLVAAAGNCGRADNTGEDGCRYDTYSGTNLTPTPHYVSNPKMYPAASNHVLSVAAVGSNNTKAAYSEYGNWIDVAAPGGSFSCSANATSCADVVNGILSLFPPALITGQPAAPTPTYAYRYLQGTSMASPQVAGVAALIMAANSGLSNEQVKKYIEDFSNKSSPGSGTNWANGAVDAYKAVYAAVNNGATPATPACVQGSSNAGTTGTPNPTAPADSNALSPTPFPDGPVCSKECSQVVDNYSGPGRKKGDANCTGKINKKDFNVWKRQFGKLPNRNVKNNADFRCVQGQTDTYLVDLTDFEIWRRNTTDLGTTGAGANDFSDEEGD